MVSDQLNPVELPVINQTFTVLVITNSFVLVRNLLAIAEKLTA